MPLCLVWEKERHSLQSRIRHRSSDEVLCCWTPLEGAESSAHCCGFFSVTSDRPFFFSSPSGRPSLQLLNPCTRGEMRRPQLQVTGKNEKEKKSPFSTRHRFWITSTRLIKPAVLRSSVVKLSMPDLFRCVWKARVLTPTARDLCNKSTFLQNFQSQKTQVAGEYLVEAVQRKKSEPQPGPSLIWASEGKRRYCIWLCMLQPIWKTALINRLHCGMKLLFEVIMVRTVSSDVVFSFFSTQKWSCCWY